MTENDLELVLEWRNHIDIRRYMYTQHEISWDEHCQWFRRVSKDHTCHLLIYSNRENIPLGFLSFQCINGGPIAEWGFYVSPHGPQGTGVRLGTAALNYAFTQLKLHKVCGEALGFNERSIKFHQRLGFQQEGVLRDQHFDGTHYHPVLCFGLLVEEWGLDHEEN
ncbi:UDP-4-amino-4,6-dideoxy-N-acetyl-beta-L-altrosamine N-acetyltransferase [Eoetvoesiella caeni]|nr:UDP-4-amino-4,6-dideoxy-N-acetyl-beta-L-altrosamine N-acetyltransferase [Eoetvoesiella caeni]MCI2807802.1 UDP-4-amino-4,6-dideoxy-N-acetyl-beta-L-altrosamine N-acetyltransferase [Eoetvoesiella caeni]NYT54195.1 UDP-4-amino-4,6-dideoxy-N-acetyl-beta-L-altrosamine N-acetyltransferase [Eoetvoesiella caeni]